MKKSIAKYSYIYIILAVLVLLATLAWAYLEGVRDGREHRNNRANQNAQP